MIVSSYYSKIIKTNYIYLFDSNLSDGVLGFDCEWVKEGPVSLLQLATYNGVVALFRLGKIGYVPPKLKVYFPKSIHLIQMHIILRKLISNNICCICS